DTPPTISVANVTKQEGQTGDTPYVFDVVLSNPSGQTITVNYATGDDTAQSSTDYTAASGQLTFAPGVTSQLVTVLAKGDVEFEPNEQFRLSLTGATNTENTTTGAIAILENDDNPPPTISVANVTKQEGQTGDTPYVFDVILSNTSGKAITVDYTTGDDTAQSSSDYTAATGQLTFAPGVTSQLVTVFAKGDTTLEGTEQFKLLLSNATNTQNVTASAIAILENDDEGAFISVGNVTQVEGLSGPSAFVFNVALSQASGLPVSVDYTTADDSATVLDNDYTTTSGTLTFATGQTILPVTVLVTGDNRLEDNDRFLLKLSNPINGAITTGNEQAIATITNDDAVPTVAIAANPITQAEGNTTTPYTFDVTLSNPSYQTITVNYVTADGTATTLDNDYINTTGQVTFSAGETLKFITANIAGDNKRESDETFQVNLTDINDQSIGSTIATIGNDDPIPTINIENAAIVEGNSETTPIVLNVTLSNPSDQPVTVNYTTEDDSATTGDNDYEAVLATSPGTVTFAAGETIKPITLNVKGDAKLEPIEQFSVKLSTPTGGTIANGTVIATINNDDNPPTLSIDNVEKREGDSGLTDFVFTVSLSSESTQEIKVDYATTNGSATTDDLDYTAVSTTTMTFAPGQTSQQITVQATGDTKREVDETFNVTLSNAVNSSIVKATGIATIQNDDQRPTIGIGKVDDSESGVGQTKNFTFAVTLSNPTVDPVTVNYTTTDGTATVTDGDYTLNAGSLTFNANETIKFITVQVKGDNKFEADEQFTIVFSDAVNADISTGAGQGVGTIKNDDDTPKVSINSVNLNEGRTGTTPFIFDITLSNPSSQPISVDFTTQNEAAQAGTDYLAQTGKVTFDPTQTSKQITVLVNGDAIVELDEDFSIVLSNPTNAEIASAIGRGAILNDDQPIRPTISIDNPSLGEGNNGTTPLIFKVILSEATSIPVSVQYGTTANTATADDYTAQTGTLNFAAGETLKEITIAVNGDSVFEPTEDFAITLSNPVSADISTIAGRGIGTIVNDDAKPKITIDSITQPEGATGSTTEYSFKVSLSNPSSAPISVRYQTVDGTATIADQDYQTASDTLTFNPGELTKMITVRVNGDTKFEPEENFFVRLTNLTPANADISTDPGQGIGTIQADDFRPKISIVNPTPQNEGNTSYNVVVSLSNPSSEVVSVNFATADSTAKIQNSDYTFNAGTLTFLPNETSKTIVVNAIADSQFELDETFAINLASPINATLSSSTATAAILNDDPLPTVSITSPTPQREGNTGITPYTFVVSLSQPSPQPITVPYSTANGTATLANNDYLAATDLITFNPGDTSKTITVNALGDTRFEPNESFTVNLTSPTNATIATSTSTATLTNDDIDPSVNADLGALWLNADSTEAQIWQFNTSTYNKTIDLASGVPGSWKIAAKADFDGDGDLDLFWFNTQTGDTSFWELNGSQYVTYHYSPPTGDLAWVVGGVGDFNGDRKPEIFWYNQRTTESAVWTLNQFNFVSSTRLPSTGNLFWKVQGLGDFNGDGRSDVLWRNSSSGENVIWLMNGTPAISTVKLLTVTDANWQIAAIGDFNNDSSLDILWRNYNTGDNTIWQLDRTRYVQNVGLRKVNELIWRIEKVGDFNRDGNLDILWRNSESGSTGIWYMNNMAFGAAVFLPTRDASWGVAETGDFDRDGNLDILWRNTVSGKADIWKLNSSPYAGTAVLPEMDELGWRFQGTSDFNRDGLLDIVWRNYITGDNEVWLMNGAQYLSSIDLVAAKDLNYQIKGVGDFDGDDNPDLLWYNAFTGDTGFWKLNGTTLVNAVPLRRSTDTSWDISAIRDFDGDGDLDILWRSRSTGQIGFWTLNNMAFFAPAIPTNIADPSWKLEGIGDFNRDRSPDLLWRNYRTGENAVWLMNGTSFGTGVFLRTVKELGWEIAGVQDFGGDANVDIFWRNAQTGETSLWYMDGTTFNLGYYLPRWTDTRWDVQSLEEFKSAV
ncbi:Calx-beta domain-containing protein, partial [Phormidesmis sp. 146-35]